MSSESHISFPTRQILGVRFLAGSAREAVAMGMRGGNVVAPSGPGLAEMRQDSAYCDAIFASDLAIPDSGLMVLLWNWLERDQLRRVSGLEYLKLLLEEPVMREPHAAFWIMPSVASMARNLAWLNQTGHPVTEEDCYLAPLFGLGALSDKTLLDLVNARRPKHIFMAIGGGIQEKLGYYLIQNLDYRPAIHCTGAAIGFLSGDQAAIPNWADRFCFAWLLRILSDPARYFPRYWKALKLIPLLWKYRERNPTVTLP